MKEEMTNLSVATELSELLDGWRPDLKRTIYVETGEDGDTITVGMVIDLPGEEVQVDWDGSEVVH